MSSDRIAIAARGLGKAYSIQHREAEPLALFDAVRERLRHPFRRMARETIWALRDVSFDIGRGEVVGLIGRNGAGKSTLLKLLSRITEPTAGEVGIWGRVGSLLEVGTGFHPQLTGRENIFLNGSILGMKRSEIRRHFDAIVDFSGVERFLDTPVKRYSSGMHVRLAFAVAVHLRPEILIVDEVLAVGDGDFQRRCLAKMDEVARSGRTILLVSHNMGSIQSLCPRVLFMQDGQLVDDGPAEQVVARYLKTLSETIPGSIEDDPDTRGGNGLARLVAVRILDASGEPARTVMGGQEITLEMDYTARAAGKGVSVLLNFYNEAGTAIAAGHTMLTRPALSPLGASGTLRCRIPRLPLTTGVYRVALAIQIDGQTADYLPRAASLDVAGSVFHPTGRALDWRTAAVHVEHVWAHDPEPSSMPSCEAVVEHVRGG